MWEFFVSSLLSGLQAASAAICSLLRMHVSCTEMREGVRTPKKTKGFSDASSKDASAILAELGMIEVIGDTTDLTTPTGKPNPPQVAVRL